MSITDIKNRALADVVYPTQEYFYRYCCRWFSKTFHTPYLDVLNMSQDIVYQAYFEENYEAMEEEDRQEDVLRALDPDYDEKEEAAIDDFIDMIEAEEADKAAKKDNLRNKTDSKVLKVSKTYKEAKDDDLLGDGLDSLEDIAKGSEDE